MPLRSNKEKTRNIKIDQVVAMWRLTTCRDTIPRELTQDAQSIRENFAGMLQGELLTEYRALQQKHKNYLKRTSKDPEVPKAARIELEQFFQAVLYWLLGDERDVDAIVEDRIIEYDEENRLYAMYGNSFCAEMFSTVEARERMKERFFEMLVAPLNRDWLALQQKYGVGFWKVDLLEAKVKGDVERELECFYERVAEWLRLDMEEYRQTSSRCRQDDFRKMLIERARALDAEGGGIGDYDYDHDDDDGSRTVTGI